MQVKFMKSFLRVVDGVAERVPGGVHVQVGEFGATLWTTAPITPAGSRVLWIQRDKNKGTAQLFVRLRGDSERLAVAATAYVWHDGVRDFVAAGFSLNDCNKPSLLPKRTFAPSLADASLGVPTVSWAGFFGSWLRQSVQGESKNKSKGY